MVQKEVCIIKVSDFTTLPGARHRSDGDGSADEFFDKFVEKRLNEALSARSTITIDLDGTMGYASSFVSQIALRVLGTCNKPNTIKKTVRIKSDEDPIQVDRFWSEIRNATK